MGPEQLGKWFKFYIRHGKEAPAFGKQTIGHENMQVRMPTCVVTEGLDSHYKTGDTFFLAQG
jgi:hypothetical protein